HAVRNYIVPKGTLKAGRNVITVRILDVLAGGGTCGKPEGFYIETGGPEKLEIPLAGTWLIKKGGNLADAGRPAPINPATFVPPVHLYNGMIHPLIKFPVKGVIWYQGESNAARAQQYKQLFPKMIQAWRRKWNQPD